MPSSELPPSTATTTPAPHSARARYVTSRDSTRIYADATGDSTRTPLILVHGFSLSAAAFDNLVSSAALRTAFYLVRYDLRGYGRSGKPENEEGYASSLFAEDFKAVCDAFGVMRPIFVGWSLGAAVLTDIATHLPADYLLGAVYLSGVPYTGAEPVARIAHPDILTILPDLIEDVDMQRFTKALDGFEETLSAPASEGEGTKESGAYTDGPIPFATRCAWRGMALLGKPVHARLSVARAQDPAALHTLGRSGALPLLILHGTADRQVVGARVVEELAPHFGAAMEVQWMQGCGHTLHYEREGEVVDALLGFSERVRGAAVGR